jgi:CDP-6-deoxy-D-xylo-4-hexulose-3-dehydrase
VGSAHRPSGEAGLWVVTAEPTDGFARVLPFVASPGAGAPIAPADWSATPAEASAPAASTSGRIDPASLRVVPVASLGPAVGQLKPSAAARVLRASIREQVAAYTAQQFPDKPFTPGTSIVPVSGKKFGAAEVQSLVDASLDFWLTTGRYNTQFEKALARTVGVRSALTVNSGSSANLLAVAAITDHTLDDRVRPGDEVITAAAGFPTTVNPLLQYGVTPVFVDVELGSYVPSPDAIAAAVSPKTKGVMLAHTLGNPVDMAALRRIADEHGLWIIEDTCDALGSTFQGKPAGSFGDLSTFSFYPAHQITMGEGGAVCTDDPRLKKIVESFRDWGRDCWCPPGEDDTCGKRFGFQLGALPAGYDHKYTYARVGYNLKITDMQAAVGCAQLERLPEFVAARRRNFKVWAEELAGCEAALVLPHATPGSDPAWFGYPITVRKGGKVTRDELVKHLQTQKVDTRPLFGGNLLRQPYFQGRAHRVSGSLANTDHIMLDTFWVGTYPGLSEEMVAFAARAVRKLAVGS